MTRRFLQTGTAALGICALIIADQASKWLVMERVLRKDGVPLDFLGWLTTAQAMPPTEPLFKSIELASFLNLVMVWNQGVSFGMFDSEDPRRALMLVAMSGAIALGLSVWLCVTRSRLIAAALALIVGGALGNIIDRLRFGAVADFIDVHAGALHWPAFNLADSGIVLGALLLAVDSFRGTSAAQPNGKHA